MARQHIVPPLGPDDPRFRSWMDHVSRVLSSYPVLLSGDTGPNSTTTADEGTIYVQNALSSATSVCWVKQTTSGNTGWVPVA